MLRCGTCRLNGSRSCCWQLQAAASYCPSPPLNLCDVLRLYKLRARKGPLPPLQTCSSHSTRSEIHAKSTKHTSSPLRHPLKLVAACQLRSRTTAHTRPSTLAVCAGHPRETDTRPKSNCWQNLEASVASGGRRAAARSWSWVGGADGGAAQQRQCRRATGCRHDPAAFGQHGRHVYRRDIFG